MKTRNYVGFYLVAFILGFLLPQYKFGDIEFTFIIIAILANAINISDFSGMQK